MKIVTSGSAYLDIDAYAGIIAQAALLNLLGDPAYAASSAPMNASIPTSLRSLEGIGLVKYAPSTNDEFILIDISKEDYFDPIVSNGRVVEVIDHHPGQEAYWAEKIGVKVDIEFIGASCTQVFERWLASGKLNEMNPNIAKLLAAGILDNTLNFNADVTTDRDKQAYAKLVQLGSLPEDFPGLYFSECQESIDGNFEQAIRSDTKTMDEAPMLPRALGQLTVWNAKSYASDKKGVIEAILNEFDEDYALNLICIGEGKSYLIASNPVSQRKLEQLLDVTFTDGVAVASRLWLRKELLKQALEHGKS